MSTELLSWLLGVSTTLFFGLLIPVLVGQLVPVSRADRAEAVVVVQKETIESQGRTNMVQADLIRQLQASGMATEQLINALKAVLPPQNVGKV